MEKSENHYDAVVVGAGLAGLLAARDLSQAGLKTLLVEGRDRLGGRTNTVQFAGHPIESGGTYFDLEKEPWVVEEFARYGLETRYTKDEVTYRTRLNGKTWTSAFPIEQVDDLIRVAYRAINDSYRVDMDKDDWMVGVEELDIPFTEWLSQFELPQETWEYVNAWISIYSGNFPTEVSALDIIGPYVAGYGNSPWRWYAGVSYELVGGSQVYRDAVVKDSPGLEIRMDTPVVRVEQEDGMIRFTTRGGKVFTSADAVWATPLNTWSDVEFHPSLSEAKKGAATTKHIGRHHKLWMRVRNMPVGVYGISYESPFKMLLHHAALDNGETLIFAMTEDTQLDCDDPHAIEQALQTIVPEAQLLESYYENWLDSEFSQGTWIVSPPGFISKYVAHLDRPEGALRFAGADVNRRCLSRMAGAMMSGRDAAAQVIQSRSATH